MFERFTEPARQVVVLAQDEARGLRHNYIGTEHLLLGLLREEQGAAARAFVSLGVTADDVHARVAQIIGQGDESVTAAPIPFTPRAKKVVELALRQALGLGHNYIDTQHLLLGLVRENGGVAVLILAEAGLTPRSVAAAVLREAGVADHARVAEAYDDVFGQELEQRPLAIPTTFRHAANARPEWLVLVGWAIGVASVGLGILIGWAIWG